MKLFSLAVAAVFSLLCLQAQAQLGPDPIDTTSEINVEATLVGNMPFVPGPSLVLSAPEGANLQSPVSTKDSIYFIDHIDGIYRTNKGGNQLEKVFSILDGDAPDGLVFSFPLSDGRGGTIDYQQRQAVFNVSPAKDKDKLYVVLVASAGSTLPDVPEHAYGALPDPLPGPCCANPFPTPGFDAFEPTGFPADLYNVTPDDAKFFFLEFPYPGIEYQIIYEFTVSKGNKGDNESKGKLVDPRPIAIFESQGGPTHHGSAMLTLKDGRILYVTGDALPFGREGDAAPQDDESHLSKLLIIDPETGHYEVAAKGLRNVQHMEIVELKGVKKDEYLAFADIGGWTAEEVNVVKLDDLLDTSVIENFGWGRNPDGLAREGTFTVGEGLAYSFGTPPVTGAAPIPDVGFIGPHAQYERPDNGDPNGGVAVTGPVTSKKFKELTMLFSDLDSGILYGTTADLDTVDATIFAITIVDEDGNEYGSFEELAGVPRVDPRFFRFPNGDAGVLLEFDGSYWRLKEIQSTGKGKGKGKDKDEG